MNPDGTNSLVNVAFSAGKTLAEVGSLLSGVKVRVS